MRPTVVRPLLACWAGLLAAARPMAAQPGPAPSPVAVTRLQAVATALGRAARLGVARADTALALAGLLTARTRPNPTLSTTYSRSVPQYHVIADLPFDVPGVRGARVQAAQAGRDAARWRFASERAAVALDVDTAYTRALASRERLRLSRRNALAADSLRAIAARRRDAGDASDLDVELAMVSAGQQANVAASDSLAYVSAVLDLQTAMGLAADGIAIALADSLTTLVDDESPDASTDDASNDDAPLAVAAARAAVRAAQLATRVQRRSVWEAPSLTAGFEMRDPSGDERGVLPTVGIAVPLPVLGRNRGPIAQAEAERDRAVAELRLAEVESRAGIARARRTLGVALEKVRRDQRLVAAADRVAAKSLTAYREGASALPNVLEAQRSARDVLAQYVDDLADAWVASATLRALTLTSDSPSEVPQ